MKCNDEYNDLKRELSAEKEKSNDDVSPANINFKEFISKFDEFIKGVKWVFDIAISNLMIVKKLYRSALHVYWFLDETISPKFRPPIGIHTTICTIITIIYFSALIMPVLMFVLFKTMIDVISKV